MIPEEQKDQLGQLIDSIDSLAHGLSIPMSAEFHLEQLKILLPEKVEAFKKVYEEITGENPWGTYNIVDELSKLHKEFTEQAIKIDEKNYRIQALTKALQDIQFLSDKALKI